MRKLILVSVWNPKGGQGKSTFSLNLAAAAVDMGLKPLVICQDPQGTSMLFYQGGNLNFQVLGRIPDTAPDADIVFFDHQASDWEVPSTNLLVMPLHPSRDQYATYIEAYARAEALEKQVITVVTNGDNKRLSERETTMYLKKQGALVVPSSGVFSRAAEEYHTIFHSSLNKAYKVGERRQEVRAILGKIMLANASPEQEAVSHG